LCANTPPIPVRLTSCSSSIHSDGKVGYLAAIATQGFRLMFETRIRALRDLQDPRESGCSA